MFELWYRPVHIRGAVFGLHGGNVFCCWGLGVLKLHRGPVPSAVGAIVVLELPCGELLRDVRHRLGVRIVRGWVVLRCSVDFMHSLSLGKLLHQWVDELLLDWSVLWCVGFVVLGLRRRTVPGLGRAVELRRMSRRKFPSFYRRDCGLLLQPVRGRRLPSLAGSLKLRLLPSRNGFFCAGLERMHKLCAGPVPIVDWGDQLLCM